MRKTVLLISGPRIDKSLRINKALDDSSINLSRKNIPQFLAEESQNSRYDQIVIHAHGGLRDANNRRGHVVEIEDGALMATADLIKNCASYTDRIFVDSCHSGALAKDLRSEYLGEVEIVAVSGSKYRILPSKNILMVENKFRNEGVDGLLDYVSTTYPDTVVVRDKMNNYSKISSVKIDQNGEIKRNLSTLNSDNKWERKGELVVNKSELADGFLTLAFAVALQRNKIDQAMVWKSFGADINANIFGGDSTILMVSAVDGNREMLENIWDMEGLGKHKLENVLLAAVRKSHGEVCDFILEKIGEHGTNELCEKIGNLSAERREVEAMGFLLHRVAETGNRDASLILVNAMNAEQLRGSFDQIIKSDSRQSAELLSPMIEQRFDEMIKEESSQTGKLFIKDERKFFKKSLKECTKKGWDVPSGGSTCVVA